MRFTKIFLVVSFFLGSGLAFAEPSSETLSAEDQIIYRQTFQMCKPKTYQSAFNLAFDIKNFESGIGSWILMAGGSAPAIQSRFRTNGLSQRVFTLRASTGFWLAMTDCYGYKYGEWNHGLLMKQIVDIGHLVSETTGAVVGITAGKVGARMGAQLFRQFPVAARFISAGMLSWQAQHLINEIRDLISNELTPAEAAQYDAAQKRVFAEPDRAISEVIHKKTLAIQRMDEKLKNPHLSESERNLLLNKKAKITENIQKLLNLRSKASQNNSI